MRRIAALALVLMGCNTDGGSANDAASAADGARPPDAAADPPDLSADPPDQSTAHDFAARPDDLARSDLAAYTCYDPGSSFPMFARGCSRDGECYVGIHQIDCCGSRAARGIQLAIAKDFEAAEANFRVICPALCDCVPRPTACDDGKTAPDNLITVTCERGSCTTHGL